MKHDACPALRAAVWLAELEERIEDVRARLAGADATTGPGVETRLEQLIGAADAARTQLAHAQPTSWPGACAQLLAAIRDQRVQDDAERVRARALELQAIRFLASSGAMDAVTARAVSQIAPRGTSAAARSSPAQPHQPRRLSA